MAEVYVVDNEATVTCTAFGDVLSKLLDREAASLVELYERDQDEYKRVLAEPTYREMIFKIKVFIFLPLSFICLHLM